MAGAKYLQVPQISQHKITNSSWQGHKSCYKVLCSLSPSTRATEPCEAKAGCGPGGALGEWLDCQARSPPKHLKELDSQLMTPVKLQFLFDHLQILSSLVHELVLVDSPCFFLC